MVTDTLELQLNKDLKNITSIKNEGPATFTIGGNEFKFDGGNVNMGGNNITNLKSGIVNNNSTDDTMVLTSATLRQFPKLTTCTLHLLHPIVLVKQLHLIPTTQQINP